MWSFEGRESELTKIEAAFHDARVGAVVISAPLGLGKTRLAQQALAELTDAHSMWVTATRSAASVPFGAVASLLPGRAAEQRPVALMRLAAEHLQGMGGRGQVAIGIDDAHLLDDASSTLIAHLVADRVAFVLMTVRTGEPLADVLAQLGKDGHAVRVELPPLPDAVMDRLLEHATCGRADPLQRRRLRELSCGNPLALRELILGAEPGGLAELVTANLNVLAPRTRYIVELVACGEPLSLPVLESLADLSELDAAERTGLIVVKRSDGRDVRLHHPLYGEVLRSRMSGCRTRLVYRALAEAVLNTGVPRLLDTLQAAVWQVEGGVIRRPDVVRAGAWRAVGSAGLELAEQLARAARAAEPGDEADRLLAEILVYRGRPSEAAEVLPTGAPHLPTDRASWAIIRAETLYWGGGDAAAANAALDTARGHEAAEASRSALLFFDARCTDAVRAARRVLARTEGDAKSAIRAAAAGAAANGFLGRLNDATRAHRRGAAAAEANAHRPWGALVVDAGACLANLACGQPAAAQSIAVAGYVSAVAGFRIGGDYFRRPVDSDPPIVLSGWALLGGLAAAARGHIVDARLLLDQAAVGFETNDTFRLARCCLAARAAVAAVRGDADAQAFMARADALAHPSNRILQPWIEIWRAWVAYARGDLRGATAAANEAVDLARATAMLPVEAFAIYELARLRLRPDLDRLDAIDHDLAGVLGPAARALAARDGATTLEASARMLRTRGYDLHAAEAYTVAAHRHQRHGRLAQAGLASARAARLSARFPGARTPLLDSARLTDLLTPREREVLLLAANHTSTQIAESLNVAVPTVNNNLARAYAKLGIHGRPQLRRLLTE